MNTKNKTQSRAEILREYERLSNSASDLLHHWNNAKVELNQQRIDAVQAVGQYAQLHNITTAELTEFKRNGRPVFSSVNQALGQMVKYFGGANDNAKL